VADQIFGADEHDDQLRTQRVLIDHLHSVTNPFEQDIVFERQVCVCLEKIVDDWLRAVPTLDFDDTGFVENSLCSFTGLR
jgi:hypothetical protein